MKMKIEVRRFEGDRWVMVPAEELVGQSIADFALSSPNPVVAALFEGDKAVAFISNREEWVEKYKEKGLSISASLLKDLVGTTIVPPFVLYTFEGATFIETGKE